MTIGKDEIKNWLKKFLRKLKRKTSRTNKCRFILSVERQIFDDDDFALKWDEIIIEAGGSEFQLKNYSETWKKTFEASKYQKELIEKIFQEEKAYRRRNEILIIERSELREENDQWDFEGLEKQNEGGEAILFFHQFEDEDDELAIRVQCFDPALFTEDLPKEKIHCECQFTGTETLKERGLMKKTRMNRCRDTKMSSSILPTSSFFIRKIWRKRIAWDG